MMPNKNFTQVIFFCISAIFIACNQPTDPNAIYESDILKIIPVSEKTYQHISFLESEIYGMVPCNGLIIHDRHEAIVLDTPLSDQASEELITWIKETLKARLKFVIPTHFHIDCTAGLDAFHTQGIPSLAHEKTIELAEANDEKIPQHMFNDSIKIIVGSSTVQLKFPGEGHTADNIIAYIPGEQVLFGGCLIKQMNAGKGNLDDANIKAWPHTVKKIRLDYPDIKYVIPGHGKTGGTELLDYTISLFEQH